MTKVRHVLGISGGKDSAALAIYLKNTYPQLEMDYYFTDTGKELDETYQLIENIEIYLGQKVTKLIAEEVKETQEEPFDYFYKMYRGYLPSPMARWCTKNMKLEPFEKYVGDLPTVSYVGIRGDENREGYISKRPNIQSIFPFRQNIWSEDVIAKALGKQGLPIVSSFFEEHLATQKLDRMMRILHKPYETGFSRYEKLEQLLNYDVVTFNHAVNHFLQQTEYPLAYESNFPLLDNADILVRDDIFRLLRESGVGVPGYYNKIEYEIEGQKAEYARSRSGCYFCFYQQKIEWIWLYETHPDKFKEAMQYENEKEGFTWNQNESLEDLIQPQRLAQIKRDHAKRQTAKNDEESDLLLDKLIDAEGEGCNVCFI
jgi:3'-phosphoadenosine 5'-phosphosulfate sulfotransferase (PAPS reductase)/FAD synthetase